MKLSRQNDRGVTPHAGGFTILRGPYESDFIRSINPDAISLNDDRVVTIGAKGECSKV